MERLISRLSKTCKIIFDEGKFDSWCVFIVENDKRVAPTDFELLKAIHEFSKQFSAQKIYDLFFIVYRRTFNEFDVKVVEKIETMVANFHPETAFTIKKWLTFFYATLIAENNKEKTKLGKRIKLLAIHQLLFQNFTPMQAAGFSKGRNWKELDTIMTGLNF